LSTPAYIVGDNGDIIFTANIKRIHQDNNKIVIFYNDGSQAEYSDPYDNAALASDAFAKILSQLTVPDVIPNPNAPVITGCTPSSGALTDGFVINGTNLGNVGYVALALPAEAEDVLDTSITVDFAAISYPQSFDIVVFTSDGTLAAKLQGAYVATS